RDHDVRRANGLVRQRFGELLAQVDADLPHRRDHRRVDLLGGSASGRAHVDAPAPPQLEQTLGHLAAPAVVGAHEQNTGIHPRRLVAFTIALCIPSATSCVNSTDTSSKPAASSPVTYSERERAPAMQPT